MEQHGGHKPPSVDPRGVFGLLLRWCNAARSLSGFVDIAHCPSRILRMIWPVERYGGPQIDLLEARDGLGSRGMACANRMVDRDAVPPPLPQLPLVACHRCRVAGRERLRRQPPSQGRRMAREDLSRTCQVAPCFELTRSWRVRQPPRCSVGQREQARGRGTCPRVNGLPCSTPPFSGRGSLRPSSLDR